MLLMQTGYALALLMGMTLGILGAGGSILTVPILVYFLGIPPVTATGYSLLVVGSTALLGAMRYYRRGEVNLQVSFLFLLPSLLSVYATRQWLVPRIPEVLGTMGGVVVTKDLLIMLLFSVLMLLSGILMILGGARLEPVEGHRPSQSLLALLGLGAGCLTGLIGAGGGFLIIPALVLIAQVPIKQAVGSSLVIISTNALVGFLSDLQVGVEVDAHLLLLLVLITMSGMWMGTAFARHLATTRLRTAFGWFTALVAVAILVKEFNLGALL